jgi:RNA-splicing ligase RtcB
VNCHHNHVQKKRHFGEDVYVTRKSAVSAKAGQLGIIPGSMGARSYIVRDAVMEAQRDLVDVAHTLKQVVCVKGYRPGQP